MKKACFSTFLCAMFLLSGTGASAGDDVIAVDRMFDRLDAFIEHNRPEHLDGAFRYLLNALDEPSTPEGCADGVFNAVSPADDYGFVHIITLTIEEGRINDVVYDEISNKQGIAKKTHDGYNRDMEESGATPAEAFPLYERALVEFQDLNRLDAVSGATYSLYRMKSVAARALMTAREYRRTGKTPVYHELVH